MYQLSNFAKCMKNEMLWDEACIHYEMKLMFEAKKNIQAKHHFEYVSRSYLDDLFVCLVVAETKEFAICGEEGKSYF